MLIGIKKTASMFFYSNIVKCLSGLLTLSNLKFKSFILISIDVLRALHRI
jgi:hypothetical protein